MAIRRPLPEGIQRTLDLYVEHRVRPGHFIRAVLENDLREAFKRADDTSREYMFEVVMYCYNDIPADCWGSSRAVGEWLMSEPAGSVQR